MKSILKVLVCALLALACEEQNCVDWQGKPVSCDQPKHQPIRHCVVNGVVVDEDLCAGQVSGAQWLYFYGFHPRGQTVIVDRGLRAPPAHGFTTYRRAREYAPLREIHPPPVPRVSSPPPIIERVERPIRRDEHFVVERHSSSPSSPPARTEPRVSTKPLRTSPVFESSRVSTAPLRTSSKPSTTFSRPATSSPRMSTAKVR